MLRCLGLTILVISALIGYLQYLIASNSNFHAELLKTERGKLKTWKDMQTYGVGLCKQPIHLKNAFPNNITINHLLSLFGDKEIEIFKQNEHYDKKFDKQETDDNSLYVSLSDFYTNDKYTTSDYYSYGQLQLLNHTEYCLLLNCKSYHPDMTLLPHNQYVGAHVFFNRGIGSGSNLHFAFGRNVFIQLYGKKHFIIVDNKQYSNINCTLGESSGGYLGSCNVDGHDSNSRKVDVKQFKSLLINEHKIPSKHIYEYVLEPGDMLMFCDIQPHLVENLTPNTMALSMRFALTQSTFFAENFGVDISFKRNFILNAIYKSISMIFKGSKDFTFLEALLHRTINSEQYQKGLHDFDPRLKGAAYHHQK